MSEQILDTPPSADSSDYSDKLPLVLQEARAIAQGTKMQSGRKLTYEEAKQMQEFVFRFSDDIALWMSEHEESSFICTQQCEELLVSGTVSMSPEPIGEGGDTGVRQEQMRASFMRYKEQARDQLRTVLHGDTGYDSTPPLSRREEELVSAA